MYLLALFLLLVILPYLLGQISPVIKTDLGMKSKSVIPVISIKSSPVQVRNMLFLIILFCSIANMHSQSVTRVEPPFWWTGMEKDHLQLMVYGEDIGSTNPSIQSDQIELIAVHKLKSDNYLFIDLRIPKKTPAGDFSITFSEAGRNVATFDYTLREREAGSSQRQGFNNADVLYLVTPDRFCNANPENDDIAQMKERPDRSAEYGRHGGDLQGISDHLDYIVDMGFTTLWLNPVLENDQEKQSYHGYATTDYYKIDPRFGSNEDYLVLSKRAKSLGIKMVMDMIANHCGSEHRWMDDPPSSDWFNYQNEPYQRSNHRKSTLLDPYVSPGDRKKMVAGWFVPTMPDLNQKNPFLATYLIQNSIWWIEYAGLAGIRQDTYPYPYRQFMADWTCAIMEEYPNFNIVGEEWVTDHSIIGYWQRGSNNKDGYESCLPSQMDFPMNTRLREALTEKEEWGTGLIKLYDNLASDHHYPNPYNMVIFPDNHDMNRIFTELKEDFDLHKIALGYILTMRGIPQLYYGTEIIMSHPGTESHGYIRSDFPGGWKNDEINAFTGTGLSIQQKEAKEFTKKLLQWRKGKVVIHHGKLMHFVPENGTYVYFRYTDDECVMVAINKNPIEINLEQQRFEIRLKGYNKGQDIVSGARFNVGDKLVSLPPKSISIFELSKD